MPTERRIVDDRRFILGLDSLYRDAIKGHEMRELLPLAREIAALLDVPPANVPVEGYYSENPLLGEYFRLIRGLQRVSDVGTPLVREHDGFRRLRAVLSSPIFGRPSNDGSRLLPATVDPLTLALRASQASGWTIEKLAESARRIATDTDDFSLVAVAALADDPLPLAATRESVVLYVAIALTAMKVGRRPSPEYIWEVSDPVARRAGRFVAEFNLLFNDSIPAPIPANAGRFWSAGHEDDVVGRCVRLGVDDSVLPLRHYHWAIFRDSGGKPAVQDFWDDSLWTTERYSAAFASGGRPQSD